jgi:multidrug resistance efflux pump
MRDGLQKIPIPWPQRWYFVRLKLLPLAVFALMAIACAALWNSQATITNAVGQVHAARNDLVAQVDGILLDHPYRQWQLYDRVEAGQILARMDDQLIVAMIATVKEEVEQAKGEVAAAEEDARTDLDDREFERFREANELLAEIERRKMAIAERNALLIEDTMEAHGEQKKVDIADQAARKNPLLIAKIDDLEYRRLRDVAQARIEGHEKYIAEAGATLADLQARLARHTPAVVADKARILQPLQATVAYQEARIREFEAQLDAYVIRSPISGYIVPTVDVTATPGQQIRRGTVVFTVAAEEPAFIVGYVRAQQRLRPEVGMQVTVRPRNSRQYAIADVEQVGPQVELVPPQQLRDQRIMEWGLPVRIRIPEALLLRPGELVDLKFILPSDRSS